VSDARTIARIVAVAAAFAATATSAQGTDAYPSRPVRVIVPFVAGGSTDVIARVIAQKLVDRWGQQFIIDNRPGAASNIGTELAARATPDGHTLVMGTTGLAANPSLYAKVPFDPLRDFAPVILIADAALAVVVHPSVPVKTLKELIAHSRAAGSKLNYASAGSATHLTAELLKNRTGLQMQHIPYKGSAPATNDLVAGQVQVMADNMLSALPHVRSGRLRALAVTTAKRTAQAPEIPTVAEQGYPGFHSSSWFGLLAPDGTPPAITASLQREIARALEAQDVRDRFFNLGVDILGGTSADFETFLRGEVAKWSRLVVEQKLRTP